MGVGAGLYMCDVVKKVHVRYLISGLMSSCQDIAILVESRKFPYPKATMNRSNDQEAAS